MIVGNLRHIFYILPDEVSRFLSPSVCTGLIYSHLEILLYQRNEQQADITYTDYAREVGSRITQLFAVSPLPFILARGFDRLSGAARSVKASGMVGLFFVVVKDDCNERTLSNFFLPPPLPPFPLPSGTFRCTC